MPQPTEDQKLSFMQRVYWTYSNHPSDDTNPFADPVEFLKAKVKDMQWGGSSKARLRSKIRLAVRVSVGLKQASILISVEDALTPLMDDEQPNNSVAKDWATSATFPG
jgi:hypothetical protein